MEEYKVKPLFKNKYNLSKAEGILIPSEKERNEIYAFIDRKWKWLETRNFNDQYHCLIVNRLVPDQGCGLIPTSVSYYKILEQLPSNLSILAEEAIAEVNKNSKGIKLSEIERLYMLIYEVSRMIKTYVNYSSDKLFGKDVDVYSRNALRYGSGDCEDMAYIAYGCLKWIKQQNMEDFRLLNDYAIGCILLYATPYKAKSDDRYPPEHFYHMSCCLMPMKSNLVPLFATEPLLFTQICLKL